MSKNIIFQYMIITDDTRARNKVPQYDGTREELYVKTADLSAKSFKLYANKIGAEHHYSTKAVLTKGKSGDTVPLFEVLRIIYDPLYDQYDKLLFVDSDIICNTEENIFDLCEDGEVFGVFESDILTSKDGGYNSWDYSDSAYNKVKAKFERRGIPVVPNRWGRRPSKITCFNTGVMVWTKEARLKARECFDDWYEYMKDGEAHDEDFWINNDQFYISCQLTKYGFDIKALEQTWNDTPTHWDDDRGYDMNFLHYTGGGNKVVMLEDAAKRKFKYL